jgi:hypothetical protein
MKTFVVKLEYVVTVEAVDEFNAQHAAIEKILDVHDSPKDVFITEKEEGS